MVICYGSPRKFTQMAFPCLWISAPSPFYSFEKSVITFTAALWRYDIFLFSVFFFKHTLLMTLLQMSLISALLCCPPPPSPFTLWPSHVVVCVHGLCIYVLWLTSSVFKVFKNISVFNSQYFSIIYLCSFLGLCWTHKIVGLTSLFY